MTVYDVRAAVYVGMIMLICTMSLVMNIVVLNVYHRTQQTHDMPNWVRACPSICLSHLTHFYHHRHHHITASVNICTVNNEDYKIQHQFYYVRFVKFPDSSSGPLCFNPFDFISMFYLFFLCFLLLFSISAFCVFLFSTNVLVLGLFPPTCF